MVFVGKKSTTESVTSSRLHSARNGMLLLCAARRAVRVATISRLSVPDDPESESDDVRSSAGTLSSGKQRCAAQFYFQQPFKGQTQHSRRALAALVSII